MPQSCSKPPSSCCSAAPDKSAKDGPLTWFKHVVTHNLEYARARKEAGQKIVGIMCEYTPRELIMAAGGVPVCLCGGSAAMIPAAEETLPANLCPLIKSTFGYAVKKANPFLEMAALIVAETTCDGKKKMYEQLAERYPMHLLELPQKPDNDDAFAHWLAGIRTLNNELQMRFGVTITDAGLREAIRVMNRERSLRRRLAALMQADLPPLTGRELLDLKGLISGIPADLEQYEKALAMLPGRKLDPPAEQRTRVLLTGVPMPHGAERLMDLIEDHGGLIVCQENCTGLKPLLEDIEEDAEDPLLAIAKKYYHLPCSVMTINNRRLDTLRTLAREYRPACVIEVIWQACLTYDIESQRVKQWAQDELGIPYLRIETDYAPSDSARIAMRIQALFETLRERHG